MLGGPVVCLARWRRLVGAVTQIAWAHATFNPWIGCMRVSPACDRCYAAAIAKRFGWRDNEGHDLWDVHAERKRTSEAYWRGPLRWNRDALATGERRRVFCASMADILTITRRRRGAWSCGI